MVEQQRSSETPAVGVGVMSWVAKHYERAFSWVATTAMAPPALCGTYDRWTWTAATFSVAYSSSWDDGLGCEELGGAPRSVALAERVIVGTRNAKPRDNRGASQDRHIAVAS